MTSPRIWQRYGANSEWPWFGRPAHYSGTSSSIGLIWINLVSIPSDWMIVRSGGSRTH